jgi:sugar phosphate isomerase/epimerase
LIVSTVYLFTKKFRLIEEGGFSYVKIVADFCHMNLEEPNIAKSIIDAGNLIKHVHLADSNRLQPSKGHIDFSEGFKALHAIVSINS